MKRLFYIFIIGILFMLVFAFVKAQITSSATPIYEDKFTIMPVYKTIVVKEDYSCFDGVSKNITCTRDVKKSVFDRDIIMTDQKIIGYVKGEEEIKGFTNEEKGIISVWNYDIGNRNMVEYGKCRIYEKEKGVCHEI